MIVHMYQAGALATSLIVDRSGRQYLVGQGRG
jgi:hypothetical protein